ncbi:MAG: hypothetical protein EKK53_19060 [Burkholderiales bacterium]|nr:MAG: hypothetical protein EKK53_19060 [Burkholderiales bacterium]
MTTAQMPAIYRRLATAIGPEHWQGAVARQEAAIRSNPFLQDYLRSEYAIAYQLEKLRVLVAARGDVPPWAFNDRSIFPALGFAAQVLGVLSLCTTKQARTFVKRVKTAFSSSENMHGLRLELQAATHFTRRGNQVPWHRANNTGTFDLLVDDLGPSGLEIECKSISDDKGRRIHRLDALNFWGEVWKDISAVAQHLRNGLAVVLTVPNRLPSDPEERAALTRAVVSGVVAGTSTSLGGGMELRLANFEPEHLSAAMAGDRQTFRDAIDAATGTTNREAALYGTPSGGMLALVIQSAVEDDVLDQVFATLKDSASRQFTGQRGSLFWVALQGLDAEQLMSVHEQDSDPSQQPTALRKGVSDFLTNAPDHVVGVVFGSRSGLYPTDDGITDMGGVTNFFVKETSPHWHESFRAPLRGSGGIS